MRKSCSRQEQWRAGQRQDRLAVKLGSRKFPLRIDLSPSGFRPLIGKEADVASTPASVVDIPVSYRFVATQEPSPKAPTANVSSDMTDRESRALVRGMLLADRKSGCSGWCALGWALFGVVFLVVGSAVGELLSNWEPSSISPV